MTFAYEELPGDDADFVRPVVPVRLAGQESVLHACLIDSGALHNWLPLWAAEAAGVPLDDGHESRIAVGGVITYAITMPVDLQIMDANWHAGVSFCASDHLLDEERVCDLAGCEPTDGRSVRGWWPRRCGST